MNPQAPQVAKVAPEDYLTGLRSSASPGSPPTPADPLHLRVYGLPAPQGSHRHVGRGVMLESSKQVKPWRQDVASAVLAAYQGPLIEGAVAVAVVFLFPRPKGHFGKRGLLPSAPAHLTSMGRGDLDKLLRSTFDALSAGAGGTLLRDDSQVVSVTAEKRYCTAEEPPGALLTVVCLY